tara:strand:+ start:202 stop:411 length:210 start_codon:yes stop_codon:yes gene_type:complete
MENFNTMQTQNLKRDYAEQMRTKHKALALLEVIRHAPKSVRCNTHHTIHIDADVMREVDALLEEVKKNA